jgi:hypothetical protein
MAPAIVCVYCERTRSVNRDGRVRAHRNPSTGRRCQGSHCDEGGFPLAPSTPSPATPRSEP